MQIGRIKNIPFIYKTIIETVMAAAEMVLKALEVQDSASAVDQTSRLTF